MTEISEREFERRFSDLEKSIDRRFDERDKALLLQAERDSKLLEELKADKRANHAMWISLASLAGTLLTLLAVMPK